MKTRSACANCRVSSARVTSKAKFVVTRHRWLARWVVAFAPLFFIASTFGQPLNIAVFSAQYSTWVYAQDVDTNGQPVASVSRTTISASPISDGISSLSTVAHIGTNYAYASSGLFEVSNSTKWYTGLNPGHADATATNQLWFSPLVDQVQAVGLQISALPAHDALSVSLLDLTSNSELWNYYYSTLGYPSNNIPGGLPANGANFNVDTDFLASHQYLLTMTAICDSNNDIESVDVQLTGLQVVPEPSSVCLLLVALLGLRICPVYAARAASKHRRT